jgi:hypothetical protein
MYRLLTMTLTELLPAVRQLSAPEKLKLIRLLTEDLEKAEDISPLEPFKTYNLPTPYNIFGAGAVLMESLNQSNADC